MVAVIFYVRSNTMSLRRQSLSYDDWARPQYGTAAMASRTPRKWSAIMAGSSYNTYRYQTGDRVTEIATDEPMNQYVGRIFLPWNGENVVDYIRAVDVLRASGEYESSPYAAYAHEYEIARALRGAIYRIVMVRDGEIVSKLAYEYRPAQHNIFLDAGTKIVLAIARG